MSELIKILHPHVEQSEFNYHEWIASVREKRDSRGRLNHRMWSTHWTKWICNNPDCFGLAIVHDQFIEHAIDAFGSAE